MGNEVQGLRRLESRVKQIPDEAREEMRKANERNAREFMAKVASIIPHTGDDKGGDLKSTLTMTRADTDTGYQVSVGGPGAPYPLHLEAGHMAPGGKKVEAKPYWNPSRQVVKKRARGRANRALNKVVKTVTSGGAT